MNDRPVGPKNPNHTVVYTRDGNLMNLSEVRYMSGKSLSGFWNWCLTQKKTAR